MHFVTISPFFVGRHIFITSDFVGDNVYQYCFDSNVFLYSSYLDGKCIFITLILCARESNENLDNAIKFRNRRRLSWKLTYLVIGTV